MKNLFKILVLVALATLVGCHSSDRLTITGTVSEAGGDTLTIKHLVNNQLKIVDTKILKKTGSFKLSVKKQKYPEYYFLQINEGNQLVLIRDSSDVINVNGDNANLKDVVIKGSQVSVRIQKMQKQVSKLRMQYRHLIKDLKDTDAETQKILSDEFIVKYNAVKDSIGMEIYKNPKSYYGYYALYQRLDAENLLFSPYDEKDYKYYAVVATAYNLYYKEDPRTIALYEMVEGVIAERRKAKLQQMVKQAPGGLPDIIMNDLKGGEHKLSDLKGKVVILNFWASKSKESRVLNKQLKSLYKKYKGQGLDIFQVSADKSKILWEAAIEQDQLPWINVCDFKEGASRTLITYNIKQVPTTFLIDKNGKMIDRFTSASELEAAIKEAL